MPIDFEWLGLILAHLPFDLTFVDTNYRAAPYFMVFGHSFPCSLAFPNREMGNRTHTKSLQLANKILDPLLPATANPSTCRFKAYFYLLFRGERRPGH